MKEQSAQCNISVLESGKHPWQCALPLNHKAPCAPYVTRRGTAPRPATTYPGTIEDLPLNGCECDRDMKALYLWLVAITCMMALFGAVLLYCSVMIYRVSQGVS